MSIWGTIPYEKYQGPSIVVRWQRKKDSNINKKKAIGMLFCYENCSDLLRYFLVMVKRTFTKDES